MPDTSPEVPPIFVSIEQAGELLGIPYMSMWKLVKDGKVEGRYIGRRRLVVLASLHDFANSLPTNSPEKAS